MRSGVLAAPARRPADTRWDPLQSSAFTDSSLPLSRFSNGRPRTARWPCWRTASGFRSAAPEGSESGTAWVGSKPHCGPQGLPPATGHGARRGSLWGEAGPRRRHSRRRARQARQARTGTEWRERTWKRSRPRGERRQPARQGAAVERDAPARQPDAAGSAGEADATRSSGESDATGPAREPESTGSTRKTDAAGPSAKSSGAGPTRQPRAGLAAGEHGISGSAIQGRRARCLRKQDGMRATRGCRRVAGRNRRAPMSKVPAGRIRRPDRGRCEQRVRGNQTGGDERD